MSSAPFKPMKTPKIKIFRIEVARPIPEMKVVFPKWPAAIMSTVSTRNKQSDEIMQGTQSLINSLKANLYI